MIDISKPTIAWDWNGTLIDDVRICIESMNALLEQRNKELLTYERYRDIFTFPVKDYYLEAGFDFSSEPFEVPAMEFIDNYHKVLQQATLFPSVTNTLKLVKQSNYNQIIISAMEEKTLKRSVADFGIENYFDVVAGINDHFANSKALRGRQVIQEFGINVQDMVFIGDTLHDKEVADDLGCRCILVSNGHQSEQRLAINGNVLAGNLKDAYALVDSILSNN